MITVETVIRKLIGEYEFVIIPGFGALLSHQVQASFDKSSGFFTPPVKKLAFNEYLKLDDGLLANYISREEKWTHSEAVEYVKSYTEKLKLSLEVNGRASIAGIGEFNKNVEGKLVFEPNTGKYFKDEWFGFEKVRVKELNKSLLPIASDTVAYSGEEEAEVIELEENTGRSRRWIGWAAAAVLTGLLCGISFFLVNSSESEIKSTLNPFTELFTGKPETQKIAEPVAKENVIVISEPVVRDSVVSAPDSSVIDSAVVNIPAETAPKVVLPESASVEHKFYVIAGAFKGKRQANVLVTELMGKGFTEASILPGDKYSTKVKVSVGGYDNEKDAYRSSAKLKQALGQEGWVFKKR